MKVFTEIDPMTVGNHPNLIAKLADDQDPETIWYLLLIDDYLIIADAAYRSQRGKWLHYQIEFPKHGLLWFVDTLQSKFFRTAAEGGLPRGVFHDSAIVDGEHLKLGRAFNADGRGGSGYAFVTLDRKDLGLAKKYIFTDSLLFEHGLLDLFKQVAHKIRSGDL